MSPSFGRWRARESVADSKAVLIHECTEAAKTSWTPGCCWPSHDAKVAALASYHTGPDQVGRVAAEARARRLVLTHLMPGSEAVDVARRAAAGFDARSSSARTSSTSDLTPVRALALGLAVAGLAAAAAAWWGMPLGTLGAPGPGLLPLALGSAVALLAAATLLERAPVPPEGIARRRAALVGVLLVLYPLLLPRLGFGATTALALFLLARAIAPVGVGRLALFALVATAAALALFRELLAVPLPRGPWGF